MFGTLFGFKGRLSRAGLIEALLSVVLLDVAAFLVARYLHEYGLPGRYAPTDPLIANTATALPIVFAVLTVWALLATAVKRRHDRNGSGWWLLLSAVPVAGWLWSAVDLFLIAGTKGANRHGRQPHSHEPDALLGVLPPEPAAAAPEHEDHAAVAGGHDDHSHDDHSHDDHGHPAEDHGHDTHGDHGHEDHGHDAHEAATQGDDAHGHAVDDHGHGAAAHDDHGHGADAQAAHDDHGDDSHGHDDHGHDSHGHADHDGGHGSHHQPAHA